MRLPSRVLLAAVCLFLSAGCASKKLIARVTPDVAPKGGYLFSNVNVFDGEQRLGERDVLVRDGVVVSVSEPGGAPAEGAEVIDGKGRTLLPGFVDAHAHYESGGNAMWDLELPNLDDIGEAYLYAGVTTTLVMQATGDQFDYAERVDAKETPSPRLVLSSPRLTAKKGFPINVYRALLPWPLSRIATAPIRTAENAEEAREAVDDAVEDFRPVFFKITSDAFPDGTPKLPEEALVAAIKRAKEKGLRPTAHVGAPEDVIVAAEAGLELFAHPPHGAPFTDAQVQRLAELKIPFASTQLFLTAPLELGRDQGSAIEREVMRKDGIDAFKSPPEGFEYPETPPGTDVNVELTRHGETLKANVMKLFRAGVPIFVGTDSGSPGMIPGASMHRELRALAAAGMPPSDILKAATSAPADFLDPKKTFGRVAPGQRADLLLVQGDPTADIAATAAIVEVFQGGTKLKRSRAE